jgi:hypothetical protein
MMQDRRRFLSLAALGLAAGGLSAVAGAQTGGLACPDPATLPFTQKTRRRGLGYTEPSTDPARNCALCAFYTAGQGGCGTCQLLSGPVNGGAVCLSFAARAK